MNRYKTRCERCRKRPTFHELMADNWNADQERTTDERGATHCLRCLNYLRTYHGQPRIVVGWR